MAKQKKSGSYFHDFMVILGRIVLNPFQYLFATILMFIGFIKFILLALGAIFTIVIVAIGFLVNKSIQPDIKLGLSDNTIIEIKLEDSPIVDGPSHLAIGGNIFRKPITPLYAMLATIDKAKNDDRIKGIILHTDKIDGDLFAILELREKLQQFKDSGKVVISYAANYGSMDGRGLKKYYLASVADKIAMHPFGNVGIAGVSSDTPFVGKALKNLGINMQLIKRAEYKSAFDFLARDKMSKFDKEQKQLMIDTITNEMVYKISIDKGITINKFKTLMDKAVFNDQQALKEGLVDVLLYEDELEDKAQDIITEQLKIKAQRVEQEEGIDVIAGVANERDLQGDDSQKELTSNEKVEYKTIQFTDYMNEDVLEAFKSTLKDSVKTVKKVIKSDKKKQQKSEIDVAIIYASGIISEGDLGPIGAREGYIRPKFIKEQFKLAKDDGVDAIILRINSGGGEVIASEKIGRIIDQARNDGIKVYVSMSNAAASGGYWLSVYADKIAAYPITVTGSIGVLANIPNLSELWKKLEINWEDVKSNENANMLSPHHKLSKEQLDIMNDQIDYSYAQFIRKVATHRNLPIEEVEKIAKGRVWVGDLAKQHGLVDIIGGYDVILEEIAKDFNLKAVDNIHISEYPGPRGFFADIKDNLPILGATAAKAFNVINMVIATFSEESREVKSLAL